MKLLITSSFLLVLGLILLATRPRMRKKFEFVGNCKQYLFARIFEKR